MKQAVQSPDHEDKAGEAGQFAHNAEAENELRSQYFAGGRPASPGTIKAEGMYKRLKAPGSDVSKYSSPATLAAFLVEFMSCLLIYLLLSGTRMVSDVIRR